MEETRANLYHEVVFIAAMFKMGDDIVGVNRDNGWDVSTPESWEEKGKIPTKLCLVFTEVAEAMEAYRKNDPENFLEELADTVIRVMDLASGMGLDLGSAVVKKNQKNKARGYRHGGKRA